VGIILKRVLTLFFVVLTGGYPEWTWQEKERSHSSEKWFEMSDHRPG
jgi:hypothetical protein